MTIQDYVKLLKIAIIVLSMATIFLLAIFQFWQHTELQKIISVEEHYSNLFRAIRNKKSDLEANIHRYMILAVMIGIIIAGGYISIISIEHLIPK